MNDVTQQIRPYLDLGEHVLWTGRPRQGIVWRDSDALLVPFGALFGVAALVELEKFFNRIGTGVHALSLPLVIMAAAIALYLVFGRFMLDAYHRSKLVYAITDRRAIILESALRTSMTWVDLKNLKNQQLDEHASGRGTIHFGSISNGHKFRLHSGMAEHPMFFQIENARGVYAILRKAMEGVRT
jgi:hypothetical protein